MMPLRLVPDSSPAPGAARLVRMGAATLAAVLLAACGPSPNGDADRAAQVTAPPTETMRDFGDHVVHFRALTTEQLSPEIARAHNITRSRNRAMLNVSVIEKEELGPGKPVRARVDASARNLTGQLKNLRVREVTEDDAIYYIGEVAVSNRETLTFEIEVTPEGLDEAYSVRFRQQFYTD